MARGQKKIERDARRAAEDIAAQTKEMLASDEVAIWAAEHRAKERAKLAAQRDAIHAQVRELLTGSERYAIVGALRIAAEQFGTDGEQFERGGSGAAISLRDEFRRRAKDARDVLEWLED